MRISQKRIPGFLLAAVLLGGFLFLVSSTSAHAQDTVDQFLSGTGSAYPAPASSSNAVTPTTSSAAAPEQQQPATVATGTQTQSTQTLMGGLQPVAAKPTVLDAAMAAKMGLPPGSPMPPKPSDAQDKAIKLARDGHFDEALVILGDLHNKDKNNQYITRDYATVLSWAGHDQDAVDQYETLTTKPLPDYLLAAAGHSYRQLHETDKALATYREGLRTYPDNVVFAEGEIRCLMDAGAYDDALAAANNDLSLHGNRPEITAAKADIEQELIKRQRDKAVQLARSQHYPEALAILHDLHAQHPDDTGVTEDYLAVLDWSGGHDADVIALYKTLPSGPQPDYVLEATGHAYRNQHNYKEANAIYDVGLSQYPDSVIFKVGQIRTLMDSGRVDEAEAKLNEDIRVHGPRPEVVSIKQELIRVRIANLRQRAGLQARAGHYDQALSTLRGIETRYGGSTDITRDRVAILSWAGRDQEAVDLYQHKLRGDQPDYVLAAVAHSYRNIGQPEQALALYQRGYARSPRNEAYAVGIIRCLTDEGYIEKAVNFANDDIARHGNRLDVLLAAGDAADQYNMYDSAHYYESALRIAPGNRAALLGLERNYARHDQPQEALRIADANPGLITEDEHRRLEGDIASAMVRAGMDYNPPTPAQRFDKTDEALAYLDQLIAKWSQDPAAQSALNRAEFDRIVALHNRSRMQDVVVQYDQLVDQGVPLPTYVVGAVGDAYLDLHQPEKARDLYLEVIQTEPNNYLIRRQLFYAYVDCDDFKDAYATADQLVADEPMYLPPQNGAPAQLNPAHQSALLLAGSARLFAGETSKAAPMITEAAAEAPNTPQSDEALGNLDIAHGWPRAALAEYQAGNAAANGQSVPNQIGIAGAQLQLQNYREAEATTEELSATYPENSGVKRTQRALDVHNMAELDVVGNYDFKPMTSFPINGGQAYGIGARIYSSPIAYNWRIYAGETYAHQVEPNNEGSIGLTRTEVGGEYRNGPLEVNANPTYNTYKDGARVGGSGSASYSIDDHWTVAGTGELFASGTPLRALNAGITADSLAGHAVWQKDETQQIRFGGGVMTFSDKNFRSGLNGDLTQQVATWPNIRLDFLADASESQNSLNENRPYYNPAADFLGLVGLRAIQTLAQRYSNVWQHALTITPGAYWEENYGTSAALRMRYEHRVFISDTFEGGVGVNFMRESFDGRAENDVGLTIDATKRF